MTCLESMPALMSLSATSRLTGSVCWAIQTVPMPPSPICSSSLYGPMTVPGRFGRAAGRRSPVGSAPGRAAPRKLPACVVGRQQRLDLARAAPASPPQARSR